jgi:hypothetical protein
VKNLNWNEIQAKIYKLLEEEKSGTKKDKQKEAPAAEAKENKSGRTVQLVDLSKLKEMGKQKDETEAKAQEEKKAEPSKESKQKPLTKEEKAAQEKARKEAEAQAQLESKKAAEEKKLKKILSASEAEGFWAKPLPQGFAFARKDMVKNMSQIYVLSKWYITKIVEQAAELAKADDKHETKPNRDIVIGASHLQTAMDVVAAEIDPKLDRDHFLRNDLKEQRQQEKIKDAKRRDVVPSWKAAPRHWSQAVPEGYAFERSDLPGNLAKFYPKVSVGAMEDVLRQATEFIGKDEPKLIAYSAHILKAIEKYGFAK